MSPSTSFIVGIGICARVLFMLGAFLCWEKSDHDTFVKLQIIETCAAVMALPTIAVLTWFVTRKAQREQERHRANVDLDLSVGRERYRSEKKRREEIAAFTRVTYHELRGPLHAISAACEMLPELCTCANPDAHLERKLLFDAQKLSLDACLRVLDDALLVDKMEANKFELHIERNHDVSRSVATACQTARYQAMEKHVAIVKRLETFVADVDPTRVQQAVSNLLSNAVKFSPACESVLVACSDGKIIVQDRGLEGIESDHIKHVFKEHNNVINFGEVHARGSGLGLYIVKNIMEAHGGSVHVESRPGNTSFTLSFPPVHTRLQDSASSESPEDAFQANATHVLLVDDDRLCRTLTKRLLLREGIRVEECGNGHRCLELCRTTAYDVILLDKEMPEFDGIEVAKQLRAGGYLGTIVGLTGTADSESLNEFLGSGVDHVVTKPASSRKLLHILKNN